MYKNFKNGMPFQIILTDNTGNIYYPNGRLAVLINGMDDSRTFMAFSDEKTPMQLASFDSRGNAFCNFSTGKLRLIKLIFKLYLSVLSASCFCIQEEYQSYLVSMILSKIHIKSSKMYFF